MSDISKTGTTGKKSFGHLRTIIVVHDHFLILRFSQLIYINSAFAKTVWITRNYFMSWWNVMLWVRIRHDCLTLYFMAKFRHSHGSMETQTLWILSISIVYEPLNDYSKTFSTDTKFQIQQMQVLTFFLENILSAEFFVYYYSLIRSSLLKCWLSYFVFKSLLCCVFVFHIFCIFSSLIVCFYCNCFHFKLQLV